MPEIQQAIAATVGSKVPTFVDVPRPELPSAGEVLCRTLQLGICGTDREILASGRPWVPDGEDFLVLGHECLARVEALGDGVTGISVGQLVVPTVRRPLVKSNVRVDMLSFGVYTERGIVKQHGFSQPSWLERPEFLLPIDDDLADIAVFTEPQSVAEKGVNEALLLQRARLGNDVWNDSPPRVLVTGQGPIAFAALIAGVARGWPVTMLGRDEVSAFRVGLAYDLGLQQYVRLDEADLSPDNVERDGYDLLLECTGSDDVLLAASGALAARGVAVWLGASRDPQPKSHNLARMMRVAVMRNHLHLGSVNAAPRDFMTALACLRQAKLERPSAIGRLISREVGFEGCLEEFSYRNRDDVKVVIDYDS